MKKTTISKAILGALGIATVTSCETINEEINGGGMVCEYGCPYAEYVVSGKVVDADKNPIENIKIKVTADYTYPDSTRTAADGSFMLTHGDTAFEIKSVVLEVEDTDGELNGGQFKSQNKTITLKQTDKGDGNWNNGVYSATDIEITLEK